MNKPLNEGQAIFMIGIGGVGMSSLARLLMARGFKVSGSDIAASHWTDALSKSGVDVFIGHDLGNVGKADHVVYSSAIRAENPEMRRALALGIPLWHRAEMLAHLCNCSETVGITGTHGKTTTSALVSYLLTENGLSPTCLTGGRMLNYDDNFLRGRDDHFVLEIDESDGSQKYFTPDVSVITNLENDHLDTYKDMKGLEDAFGRYLSSLGEKKCLIISAEDAALRKLSKKFKGKIITYGLSEPCDYYANNVVLGGFCCSYDLYSNGRLLGHIRLSVPGRHNVMNSLAAVAVALRKGITIDDIENTIGGFAGVSRRLEVLYKDEDLMVVDDYAHHPSEIKATLRTLKEQGKEIICVFQPHRFTRTQQLAHEFGKSFDSASHVILTDIYPAGEKEIKGVSIRLIEESIEKVGRVPAAVLEKREIIGNLSAYMSGKDKIIAFLGAGDIGDIAHEFAGILKDRVKV